MTSVMQGMIGIGVVLLITDMNPLFEYHAWGLWWLALISDFIIILIRDK